MFFPVSCFTTSDCVFIRIQTVTSVANVMILAAIVDVFQVLTSIGNFCICSIAAGMVIELLVMYAVHERKYRQIVDNLLVLLIGGIPIAMPTVLSVTMAVGSHKLAQQVCLYTDGQNSLVTMPHEKNSGYQRIEQHFRSDYFLFIVYRVLLPRE